MLGRKCASMLNSVCVSRGLSRSYGESSLRFTCRHGHNFFLSVHQVKQTYITLKRQQGRTHLDRLFHELEWCNKCAKQVNKMIVAVRRRGGIEVLSGINCERISLACHKCQGFFTACFKASTKKPETVNCIRCLKSEAFEQARYLNAQMEFEARQVIMKAPTPAQAYN